MQGSDVQYILDSYKYRQMKVEIKISDLRPWSTLWHVSSQSYVSIKIGTDFVLMVYPYTWDQCSKCFSTFPSKRPESFLLFFFKNTQGIIPNRNPFENPMYPIFRVESRSRPIHSPLIFMHTTRTYTNYAHRLYRV